MQQIKEYTILTAFSPLELIDQVNSKLNEGWQPVGGTSFVLKPITTTEANDPVQLPLKQGSIYAQALGR